MDGDEDTLPIYHGQRTTGALNYYPATATQQQSAVDTSQYVHYPQQPPPPSQLAPPPQSSRSGGGRMYPLETTNGGHNPLNRSISISSSTRRPQDGADGGYALDQATQTQSLSFYPAFHTHDSLSNQPTQQPDSGPAYYQGQPRRAHTQIDTRSAHHSPRRQLVGPVSPPLPSPVLPSDSQTYRTNPDPYAPPSHPPSFPKPPATTSSYGSPPASTTAYSPSISGNIYTPPSGPPAALAAAPDSLYPAHQQLPRTAIQPSQQPPGPSTPHGYGPSVHQQQQYYLPSDQIMAVEPSSPAPKRKACGFKRVRDANDLRPMYAPPPSGVGQPNPKPLRALTTNISQTFNNCNPQFTYEASTNPRRVLTKPSKPAHNDGYDNEDYDYILYVNDLLGTEDGHKYLILDVLGQGTFGQVVKCQNIKTHEIVAVKVVKNKPAYFNQSMMEVTLLEMLNKEHDPDDEHHILRLRDSFIHRNHLCLVFELLSSNLYELIKQNSFSGLSTQLVKVFTAQLLDALTVLREARLIHCDLKPENILLKSLQSPQIKVIDFGSACHEKQTVYTYIQSRFYRSPEVLLGMPYTTAIDMWSLGCIAVELFLGLPLFPGTSEYNQITRIVEMLGLPPQFMLDMGKQTNQFFDSYIDAFGTKRYQLKSMEKYSREHNTNEQPGKKYFSATTLPEIIKNAPIPAQRAKPHEIEKEHNNRLAFIDFVQGLLNLNPMERWSPQQARSHPFITGDKFTGPFVPQGATPGGGSISGPNGTPDPERPYGGLLPSQPKGTRAYRDAASYNQQLNQHQAYTQAQAVNQQPNPTGAPYRNPYLPPGQAVPPPAQSQAATAQPMEQYSPAGTYNTAGVPPSALQQTRLPHHAAMGSAPSGHGVGQYSMPSSNPYTYTGQQQPPATQQHSRPRAGADIVPPAIARIANMGTDSSGIGRHLTPVINRDDAMKEWERRQSGKHSHNPYQPLEYLQQQAELLPTWNTASRGYIPASSGLYHAPTGQSGASLESGTRLGLRDVMSSVRSAANAGADAYNTTPTTRYPPPSTYQQQAQQTTSTGYETFEQRAPSADMASMYVPLQPLQAPIPQGQSRQPPRPTVGAPPAPSPGVQFYGASAVPAGLATGPVQQQQHRGIYGVPTGASPIIAPGQSTSNGDGRGTNGMDVWQR